MMRQTMLKTNTNRFGSAPMGRYLLIVVGLILMAGTA